MKNLFAITGAAAMVCLLSSCASTDNEAELTETLPFIHININSGEADLLDREVACNNTYQFRFGQSLSEQSFAYKNLQAKYVSGVATIIGTPAENANCVVTLSLQAELFASISNEEIINGAAVYQGDFIQSIHLAPQQLNLEQDNYAQLIDAALLFSAAIHQRQVPVGAYR
ncbi:hypothetical protein [Catenovulum sediminis]|uniref:Lipoprotein n=1 Tax=Catenovulum sediminis TaxID=1740262 RepID=A0ABV1RMC7_9ALTE|nr:hypothetical protein [Catenovulum sediminis]